MKGARFKVYQDDAKHWRWRLQSANGRILADSGEGYTRKRDAWRSAHLVAKVSAQLLHPIVMTNKDYMQRRDRIWAETVRAVNRQH